MVYHKLIEGANFSDERGNMSFFNTLDMKPIVRFYQIAPANTDIIRAWQAHKREMKWFYCQAGAFVIHLIQLDDFENPSSGLKSERFLLEAKSPKILEISGGYATGFKATEENSKLQVFSNYGLEASKDDDFRYPIQKWDVKW